MDRWLLSLRRFAQSLNLARTVTILRQLIHFGPWRHLFILLFRIVRKPSYTEPASQGQPRLFDSIRGSALLTDLTEKGVGFAGTASKELIIAIRSRTDLLPRDHFPDIHEADPDIRRLVTDKALLNLVRRYLCAEPVMLECTLIVTEGGSVSDQDGLQSRFHFDYAGWHSVNVFVYLTDVGEQSAFHTVIAGTHRRKTIGDIFKQFLSDDEAQERFGNQITPVFGTAGTVFFENTEAFHKRQPSPERRVMLNILYASHSNWLSKGRSAPGNIHRRDRLYRQLLGSPN